MFKVMALILAELLPFIVLGLVVWLGVRRAVRRRQPEIDAYRAWQQRGRELAAQEVAVSYKADNMGEMLAVKGELEAHALLKPELPAWMFWIR